MPLAGFWKKLVNLKDDPSAERSESPAKEEFTNGQSSHAEAGSSQKGEEKPNDRYIAAKPESANRPRNANKPATSPPAATNKARTKAKIGDKTLATGTDSSGSSGFFQKARNIVIKQSTMIDKSQTIHNLIQGKTALEVLSREMTPGADVDSSARWPPPSCHPGTRVSLTTRIQSWLFDDNRMWDFLWLHGPAGVGKTAVAQTIAEFASKNGVLGAAFFFSRPNERHNYLKVFITLAYQLAVRFPGYQPLVAKTLAADPDLLEKAPNVQFKRLIVEPLSSLSHERKHLIVLDGLDECNGERAQLEIIELINNLILTGTSLPIIWMICSRPESHLKRAFLRADYIVQCWREELPVDTREARSDTAIFIRARFREIHNKYRGYVEEDADGSWPSEAAIAELIDKASGLFALASTSLLYIENSESSDPDKCLREVLAVLKHSHITGSRNPLGDLDLLFTRILSDVPDDLWPITRRILVASTFHLDHWRSTKPLAAQAICNLLCITRTTFYAAMRKLHSIVIVPEPGDAAKTPLRFFHASFLDYLTSPSRSGRFSIGKLIRRSGLTVAANLRDFVFSGLRSLQSDMALGLVALRFEEIKSNQDASRSMKEALSWPSRDNDSNWRNAEAALAKVRNVFFRLLCALLEQSEVDDELLDVLRGFDFNVLNPTANGVDIDVNVKWHLAQLSKLRPSSLVRTHSTSEWDNTLLSALAESIPKRLDFENYKSVDRGGEFFLLGCGENTIAVVAELGGEYIWCYSQKELHQLWPSLRHVSDSWDDLHRIVVICSHRPVIPAWGSDVHV